MNSVKNNGGCDRMNSLFKEMLNFSLLKFPTPSYQLFE